MKLNFNEEVYSTSEHEYTNIDYVSVEGGTYYPIEFLKTLSP